MEARDLANPHFAAKSGEESARTSVPVSVKWAVCGALVALLGAGSIGLLSQEGDPKPANDGAEWGVTYDGPEFGGPGDGEPAITFRLRDAGPGDGEPAITFRLGDEGAEEDLPSDENLPSDEDLACDEEGLLIVYVEGKHVLTVPLPLPEEAGNPDSNSDDTDSDDEGIRLRISRERIEGVLGYDIDDPDLQLEFTFFKIRMDGFAMRSVIGANWNGYLHGYWLESPKARATEGDDTEGDDTEGDDTEGDDTDTPPSRLLSPRVDVSETMGRPMPIDLRLEKSTIYYMLFASEDREAVLLHPENPEIYTRATLVAAGPFFWDQVPTEIVDREDILDEEVDQEPYESPEAGDGVDSDPDDGGSLVESPDENRRKHLRRLSFTPTSDRTYLVLWALHKAEAPAEEGERESDGDPQQGDVEELDAGPRVNGWTRSAVYVFTNGPAEDEPEGVGVDPATE